MENTFIPFAITEAIETKEDNQNLGRVSGIGSTFGEVDLGGDRILKGAFKETLKEHKKNDKKIKMMVGHREVIGGWTEFKESNDGLIISGDINLNVQKGQETYALAKQKVLTDLSIGYIATDYAYIKEKTGTIREIKKLKLFEVSLVAFPMNPSANILDIKSCQSITDISKYLKTKGISNKETNEIVYQLKSFARNDSKDQDEFDEKSRNEILESLDNVINSLNLNNVINRSKNV